MLKEKIKGLTAQLMEEAALAEKMAKDAVKILTHKEPDLFAQIKDRYEPQLNRWELKLDELCINLIALYQPEAGNLRAILMALKINNDLERIGDLAVNVSESAFYLARIRPLPSLDILSSLADKAISMLKDAVSSFIAKDSQLAKDVCWRDNAVDELHRKIVKDVAIYMKKEDAADIEACLHILRISHNLERISDLSTNICEDVIFMVEGDTIKHYKK